MSTDKLRKSEMRKIDEAGRKLDECFAQRHHNNFVYDDICLGY